MLFRFDSFLRIAAGVGLRPVLLALDSSSGRHAKIRPIPLLLLPDSSCSRILPETHNTIPSGAADVLDGIGC